MFSKLKDLASGKAEAMLEEQAPKIAQHFREKVGPLTAELLKDDVAMTNGLNKVYDFMAIANPGLGLLVKKEQFVEFCLSTRHRLPLS